MDKLFELVNGKTSQGVKNYLNEDVVPKGVKFSYKMLQTMNFLQVNPNKWKTDKQNNDMIRIVFSTPENNLTSRINSYFSSLMAEPQEALLHLMIQISRHRFDPSFIITMCHPAAIPLPITLVEFYSFLLFECQQYDCNVLLKLLKYSLDFALIIVWP